MCFCSDTSSKNLVVFVIDENTLIKHKTRRIEKRFAGSITRRCWRNSSSSGSDILVTNTKTKTLAAEITSRNFQPAVTQP